MAELADAPDLGSGGTPRAGSSPVIRTEDHNTPDNKVRGVLLCLKRKRHFDVRFMHRNVRIYSF